MEPQVYLLWQVRVVVVIKSAVGEFYGPIADRGEREGESCLLFTGNCEFVGNCGRNRNIDMDNELGKGSRNAFHLLEQTVENYD